jgi:hypothetical protein
MVTLIQPSHVPVVFGAYALNVLPCARTFNSSDSITWYGTVLAGLSGLRHTRGAVTDGYGVTDGMMISRENRRTREKYLPQCHEISLGVTQETSSEIHNKSSVTKLQVSHCTFVNNFFVAFL